MEERKQRPQTGGGRKSVGAEGVKLLGITGTIGAGKSRVAAWLGRHGELAGIDVDLLSQELLQPDQPGLVALVRRFGSRFLTADGLLDRSRLRREIFTDSALKSEIDALLHPLIRRAMQRQVAELAGAGSPVVLVEVPLLYEAGWAADFDLVMVVTASEEVCLQRIILRDGVSRAEALAALAARLPQAEKVRRADLVIDNSGSWEQTRRQLAAILPRLRPGEKNEKKPEKP